MRPIGLVVGFTFILAMITLTDFGQECLMVTLYLGLVGLLPAVMGYALGSWVGSRSLQYWLMTVLVTPPVLLLAWAHMWMSSHLTSLKAEFYEVIETTRPSYAGVEPIAGGDDRIVHLSYGGRLDTIVRRRNDILREHHYLGVGSWEAGSYRSTAMVYIPRFWESKQEVVAP